MLFNQFLLRRGMLGEEVIVFLISIQACSRISTPLAIDSYQRELTSAERQQVEAVHQAMLKSNELVATEDSQRVRLLLRELGNYLLSLNSPPLCDMGGCGACCGCEEWESRRQTFYKVLRAARDDDDLLADEDPAWHVMSAAWDICRDHYPGTFTFEALAEEIERRHNRYYDLPLLAGAISWAVSMHLISRLPSGVYRYYRTSGTRMGGPQASDCTAGFFRGSATRRQSS